MLSERKIVSALCLVAALRVFIFSAGFPFFNNVDEDAHFDLALRYSHGELPRRLEPMSPETAEFVALFGTAEYFLRPEQFPGGKVPPPLWTLPPERIAQLLPPNVATSVAGTNHRCSNPPL